MISVHENSNNIRVTLDGAMHGASLQADSS